MTLNLHSSYEDTAEFVADAKLMQQPQKSNDNKSKDDQTNLVSKNMSHIDNNGTTVIFSYSNGTLSYLSGLSINQSQIERVRSILLTTFSSINSASNSGVSKVTNRSDGVNQNVNQSISRGLSITFKPYYGNLTFISDLSMNQSQIETIQSVLLANFSKFKPMSTPLLNFENESETSMPVSSSALNYSLALIINNHLYNATGVNKSLVRVNVGDPVTAASSTNDELSVGTKFIWYDSSNSPVSEDVQNVSNAHNQTLISRTFTPSNPGEWRVQASFMDENITLYSLSAVFDAMAPEGKESKANASSTKENESGGAGSGSRRNQTETNESPNAEAGKDQTVVEGDIVMLNGTNSTDSDGTIELYAWKQESGPQVQLNSSDVALTEFIAPAVSDDTELGFDLQVTDNDKAIDTDRITILVKNKEEPILQPEDPDILYQFATCPPVITVTPSNISAQESMRKNLITAWTKALGLSNNSVMEIDVQTACISNVQRIGIWLKPPNNQDAINGRKMTLETTSSLLDDEVAVGNFVQIVRPSAIQTLAQANWNDDSLIPKEIDTLGKPNPGGGLILDRYDISLKPPRSTLHHVEGHWSISNTDIPLPSLAGKEFTANINTELGIVLRPNTRLPNVTTSDPPTVVGCIDRLEVEFNLQTSLELGIPESLEAILKEYFITRGLITDYSQSTVNDVMFCSLVEKLFANSVPILGEEDQTGSNLGNKTSNIIIINANLNYHNLLVSPTEIIAKGKFKIPYQIHFPEAVITEIDPASSQIPQSDPAYAVLQRCSAEGDGPAGGNITVDEGVVFPIDPCVRGYEGFDFKWTIKEWPGQYSNEGRPEGIPDVEDKYLFFIYSDPLDSGNTLNFPLIDANEKVAILRLEFKFKDSHFGFVDYIRATVKNLE